MKYEQALKQLETIVSQIENGEVDLDELGLQLKKAKELIKFCKDKLTKTDEEIRTLLEEDIPSGST